MGTCQRVRNIAQHTQDIGMELDDIRGIWKIEVIGEEESNRSRPRFQTRKVKRKAIALHFGRNFPFLQLQNAF